MRYLFLVLCLTICIIPALGNKTIEPSLNTTTFHSQHDTGLSDGEAYKLLYENQKEANGKILDTIFYALSGLAVAILFVLAGNWWFNEKKVSDVRNSITAQINQAKEEILNASNQTISDLATSNANRVNELSVHVQKELAEGQAEMSKAVNDFFERARLEAKGDYKTLIEGFQKQLEQFNENYRQQIAALTTNLATHNSDIRSLVDTTQKEINRTIEFEISLVRMRIERIEYHVWSIKDVPLNALRSLVGEIEATLRNPHKYEWDYNSHLDNMIEVMKKISQIDSTEVAEITRTLNKLPEKFSDKRNGVLSRLARFSSN